MTELAPNLYCDHLFEKAKSLLDQYWLKYPDLWELVQKNRESAANDSLNPSHPEPTLAELRKRELAPVHFLGPLRGAALRKKINESHRQIRERVAALNAPIIPLTAAHNRKCSYQTMDEEREHRAELMAAQLKTWRSLLPKLIKRFAKIHDPRRAESIDHKITVLMVFGLFAFVFKMSSRREMNRELTSPTFLEHLRKIFPEVDSIPHADTLARLLAQTNPAEIEAVQLSLIRDLISNKKLKRLLIQGCLPVTVDGAQKLCRDGLLHDARWCERTVGESDKQQYVYAVEANITLANGLSIPLATEYLYRENNQLLQRAGKQDNENTAFERMAERLKKYFPRLKVLFLMDVMFATQSTMGLLHKNQWEFIVRLPKDRLVNFAHIINKEKQHRQEIPEQPAYRNRQQEFYWHNNILYGYELQLKIHLGACMERYLSVDKSTGDIIDCFSEHAWISSIKISIYNVHELFNLGARKKELIEDSINTEKNRGYHYKHAFSYNWNAMQGFHYLMRLGHAVNALSQFSKSLKRYIKEHGVSATLKMIKETFFSPWLTPDWYEAQTKQTPQLRLLL